MAYRRSQSEQCTWRLFPYDGPGPYDDDNGGESRWKPGTSPEDTDPEEEGGEESQVGGKETGQ
ncbi:hypothetical protein [Thermogemmatispora sp.]|uniref:hypothetical protein n=1 Tax=Thermogemmatispora sp. TaxID=1968838 RepID=UPI001D274632|nr:hypothetical protein [Thermogemmatispora sp.]MBX5450224.1 hypothetical protein [Thermogemmatispora sp.]